jgi:NADH-quinone oxidoreductase subunit F
MGTSEFDSLVERSRKDWTALMNPDEPVIYLGAASCGLAAGIEEVKQSVVAALKENELTARLVEVGCIGPCYLEPLMDIAAFGNPRLSYGPVNGKSARLILENYLLHRNPRSNQLLGHFSAGEFDGIPRFFDQPMLRSQLRIVLRNCGLIDPGDLGHYLAQDGYQGLRKALSMSPDSVIDEVTEAGLRGRGGAGFLTGKKWRFCRNVPSDIKYMICNADEGDPGAFMNRSLIEGDPHALLEGLLIAAYAIGASTGYIYIRAEYPLAIQRLKKAIAQIREVGLLGPRILGFDFSFEIKIKEGAGAFVCGEETALIHSIEGKRGMPRTRPPFPAVSGLHGKPTVINNVETLATLPHILRNGSAWYQQFGVPGNHGTKTFSIVGKARRTGMVEVSLGMKLRDIIFDVGGGSTKPFKGVQTGGPSGGCLSESYLETPVEYEALAKAGSIMGSGGLIVMDEDTCMVDIARYFMSFCAAESCGKCTPCRMGTTRMHEILERICRGQGTESDLITLERIGKSVKATSLCGLGQTSANPVLSTLRNFRREFEDHVLRKRCSAGVCQSLFLSPCQNACPVGMDVPGYVSMIAAGRFEEAVRIGRETNPFLSICGRVCDHPCMSKCRRNQLDEPVAIRTLKRFIGDYARTNHLKPAVWVSPEKRDERVAIVGAGPSGLSCSYFLARLGYRVTVFERLPVVGGMLAVGIPAYRLPRELLESEVQLIRDLGVEIRTGVAVGRDVTIRELLNQGYKAVYLAVGMSGDRAMGIPGENCAGVLQGVDFLTDVSLGKRVEIGHKVAVVGGGNTAVDAARTLVRLGAEEVTIVYRRTREEMPAFAEEIQEAEQEGVKIILLAAPARVIADAHGKATALECTRMKLGDFDNKGRRVPVPIENSTFRLDVDRIISAIGEFADVSELSNSQMNWKTNRDGTIAVDDECRTSVPGVFAGGDVAIGAATVVKAVAAGERAAVAIDGYLTGSDRREYPWRRRRRSPVPHDTTVEPVVTPMLRNELLPVPVRRRSFAEVQAAVDPETAMKEAQRCLRCDFREEEGV